jgi:flagellar hook-length control protein FliK
MLAGEQAPAKSDAPPKNDDGKPASGNSSATAADANANTSASPADGSKASDTDIQPGLQQTAQKQDAGKADDGDPDSASTAQPANDNNTPLPIDAAMIQVAMAIMPTPPVQPPTTPSPSSGDGQQTTAASPEAADGTLPAATVPDASAGPQTPPSLQPPLLAPAPLQPATPQEASAPPTDGNADDDAVPGAPSLSQTASAQAPLESQPAVPVSGNSAPADMAANMPNPAAAPSFATNGKPQAAKGQAKDGDSGGNTNSNGTTDASSAALNLVQSAVTAGVQQPAPPPVAAPVAQTNVPASADATPIAGTSSGTPATDGAPTLPPPVPSAGQNGQPVQTGDAGQGPAQPSTDKNSAATFGAALNSATPSHGEKIGAPKDASQSSDGSNSDAQQGATASAPVATPAPSQPAAPNADPLASGIIAAPHAANTSAPAPTAANVTVNVHVTPQDQTPAPNVNSLAVEIAAKSQSGAKQFDIRLDPPELGRIEVRLSIDATGKAQAHMTVDQPQTLDLMQKDSSSLTRALRDAGLDVSQNGLNFSLKGQDRNGDGGSGNTQTRTPSQTLAATRSIDAVQSSSSYLSSAGDARLDIHV